MRIESLKRPNADRDLLTEAWPDIRYFTVPFILGVRGWANFAGQSSKNQRAVYDDAIFVIGREGEFYSFNANTDPTEFKAGRAVLQPGTYQYQLGIHNRNLPEPRRHLALVQAAKVKIHRDGAAFPEEGFFAINIHRGGKLATGSEGCQTIPSDQWQEFIDTVQFDIMEHYSMRYIYYKLVEYKVSVGGPL